MGDSVAFGTLTHAPLPQRILHQVAGDAATLWQGLPILVVLLGGFITNFTGLLAMSLAMLVASTVSVCYGNYLGTAP